MKKLTLFLMLMLLLTSKAGANLILQPDPVDLYDLEHGHYYTWGLDADAINEVVSGWSEVVAINLTFYNIYNWEWYGNQIDDSRLFVWMLDGDVELGVTQFEDPHSYNAYYDDIADLEYEKTNLINYETPDGDGNPINDIPYGDPVTITYTFGEEELAIFLAYLNDGDGLGLAFDPDCHYYNSGISLELVPEPATILLLGFGLIGLACAARKRSHFMK